MIKKPGKYTAKLVSAGIVPNKNMLEQPYMQFETSEGTITWYGALYKADGTPTEKGQEIAVKAALAAGFKGNDWNDFAKGLSQFNIKEVQITVEEETYNGKTRLKVKWVNPLSGEELKSKAYTAGQVKVTSSGLFAKARKEETTVKTSTSSDEIPF